MILVVGRNCFMKRKAVARVRFTPRDLLLAAGWIFALVGGVNCVAGWFGSGIRIASPADVVVGQSKSSPWWIVLVSSDFPLFVKFGLPFFVAGAAILSALYVSSWWGRKQNASNAKRTDRAN